MEIREYWQRLAKIFYHIEEKNGGIIPFISSIFDDWGVKKFDKTS